MNTTEAGSDALTPIEKAGVARREKNEVTLAEAMASLGMSYTWVYKKVVYDKCVRFRRDGGLIFITLAAVETLRALRRPQGRQFKNGSHTK